MPEFSSPVPLPPIPDDISIPQFIFQPKCMSRPNRPANIPVFVDSATGRALFYDEVRQRTFSLANGLSIKYNIAPKDVVCVFAPNDVGMPFTAFCQPKSNLIADYGSVLCPANPGYTADELKHLVSLTDAKLVITHPSCLNVATAAARDRGIAEDCIILFDSDSAAKYPYTTLSQLMELGRSQLQNYTSVTFKPGEGLTTIAFLSFSSGTTGKPKAVAIPHASVIANTMQQMAHFGIDDPQRRNNRFSPGDIGLGVLPFFHASMEDIYGLVHLHFSVFYGASIVVVPKFSFEDFLNTIIRYKITHLYLVPPQIVLLCKHPAVNGRKFDHVKVCLSGAAPLSGDLMSQLAKIIPNAAIGQGYGMTETGITIGTMPRDRKMGTVGSAGELAPGVRARVVKPDGTLAEEGEHGELVVTGPALPKGYYRNPTATAETFVDGWVYSGDIVYIRNNEVFVVDRIKEIMKVRGFQVAPAELEGQLLQHPDVADACVVGILDEYSGELPLAFVVLSQDALRRVKDDESKTRRLKEALQKHVADTKIYYKHLVGVEFIESIPKSPAGKILRRVLKDQAQRLPPSKAPAKAKL
ncbi:hypothetical protein CVT24_012436 [Panaeolus cyanescens]|uniref:AMP-dependent synthetase/ligase domain-containing protein n=1 Tax=Panaeolus cyanescens TaxID=181874 RepID=A0A409YJ87_9AGAR|nr:hypothetical protein CVT24_012436 [Panaeolus cyanescens]